MDEFALEQRLQTVLWALDALYSARNQLAPVSGSGSSLVASTHATITATNELIGGTATGADASMRTLLYTALANGQRFHSKVSRAESLIDERISKLESEAEWLRAEIARREELRRLADAAAARRD